MEREISAKSGTFLSICSACTRIVGLVSFGFHLLPPKGFAYTEIAFIKPL
jgi:hypothetical protein